MTIEEIKKAIAIEKEHFKGYHATHQKVLASLRSQLKHAKRNNIRTIAEAVSFREQDSPLSRT